MNQISNQQTEIRVIDVIKKLAIQWKAILLTALLMALIMGGLRYYKDVRGYESAKANAAEIARINKLPAEERIAEILAPFSESEKNAILNVAGIQEWISIQTDDLTNSLLSKTDPTSQRTLLLSYSAADADNTEEIVRDCGLYVYDDKVIEALKPLYGDPEIEDKYISELINYPFINETASLASSDSRTFSISVILLDDTDAEAVEKAMTKALKEHSSGIQLIGSEIAYVQNQRAIDSRNNMYGSVSNLKTISDNERNKLSGAQQAALNSINEIKAAGDSLEAAADAAEAEASVPAPSVNKKYVMMGFVLGIVLYALIYAVLLVLRACVNTSSDAEKITGARSLGEVCYSGNDKGLRKLLHSSAVQKRFYKEKLAENAALDRIATAAESVCRHNEISKIALIKMTDDVSALVDAISGKGIEVHVIEAENSFNEEDLVNEKDGVIAVGNNTRAADLSAVTRTCRDYDIDILGNIYIGVL